MVNKTQSTVSEVPRFYCLHSVWNKTKHRTFTVSMVVDDIVMLCACVCVTCDGSKLSIMKQSTIDSLKR